VSAPSPGLACSFIDDGEMRNATAVGDWSDTKSSYQRSLGATGTSIGALVHRALAPATARTASFFFPVEPEQLRVCYHVTFPLSRTCKAPIAEAATFLGDLPSSSLSAIAGHRSCPCRSCISWFRRQQPWFLRLRAVRASRRHPRNAHSFPRGRGVHHFFPRGSCQTPHCPAWRSASSRFSRGVPSSDVFESLVLPSLHPAELRLHW